MSCDWQCISSCISTSIGSEWDFSRILCVFFGACQEGTFFQSQKLQKQRQGTPIWFHSLHLRVQIGTKSGPAKESLNGCLWRLQRCLGMFACDLEGFVGDRMETCKEHRTSEQRSGGSAQGPILPSCSIGRVLDVLAPQSHFWPTRHSHINRCSQISGLLVQGQLGFYVNSSNFKCSIKFYF